MAEVVPAILEETLEEIKNKVELVKPFVKRVQIDVMDGEFVPNRSYNMPGGLDELGIPLEIHLMIMRPEFYIAKWALKNVEYIIIHQEAVTNMEEAIRLIKDTGKKVGVAINPGTSTYDVKPYLENIDLMLVMGVNPGFSGQAFQYDVLEKIKHFKKIKPDLLIEVDGGVGFDTKNVLLEAGVDILAANSCLFNADNIEEAIKQLKQ